jgi:hypothetical protein
MRMWNVPTEMLCNQHLLGEHVEMHMFAGSIRLGKSIVGFIAKGFVETDKIKSRHDALAVELLKRGFRHNSPMDDFDILANGKVDIEANLVSLSKRCVMCRMRIDFKKEV